MKRTSLFCAALLTLSAVPAFAEPVVTGQRSTFDDDGRLTRNVGFRDLDLASAAGQKTLVRRVSGAVREVCRPAGDPLSESYCQSYAWRGARPQIELALNQARSAPALAQATLSTITISAGPS